MRTAKMMQIGRPLPKAIFTQSEIQKILAQALVFGFTGMRDRAILETFFATGMRRTELIKLDIEDVDLNEQQVRIRKGKEGKGGRERIVLISERGCKWVVFYLSKVRPRQHLHHPDLYPCQQAEADGGVSENASFRA